MEYLPGIKYQTCASIGHLSLSLFLRILDINNGITAKNPISINEMLHNHIHLLCRRHKETQCQTLSHKKWVRYKTSYLPLTEEWLRHGITDNNNSTDILNGGNWSKRIGRQRKMNCSHHWVNWKIIHRNWDNKSQTRHLEVSEHVLSCEATSQP